MNISTTAAALLAALLTSAASNAAPSVNGQDSRQTQQEQNDDASAHGYQNPTGQDPDPRMTGHPNSEPEVTEEETADDDGGSDS